MKSIINEAANGEKMKLWSLFLPTEMYLLAGSRTNCNFQVPCSCGLLNATWFWCAGLTFRLQMLRRTVWRKWCPCVAFQPCSIGVRAVTCQWPGIWDRRTHCRSQKCQTGCGERLICWRAGLCREGHWQAGGTHWREPCQVQQRQM